MLEVLTPGACICDLIWKYSLCIYNQIKMRLFWIRVIPKPVTCVLLRREKFGPRHTWVYAM